MEIATLEDLFQLTCALAAEEDEGMNEETQDGTSEPRYVIEVWGTQAWVLDTNNGSVYGGMTVFSGRGALLAAVVRADGLNRRERLGLDEGFPEAALAGPGSLEVGQGYPGLPLAGSNAAAAILAGGAA